MRRHSGSIVAIAAFLLLIAFAGTASAARTYDSKITPFNSPKNVVFEADGSLWVSDWGQANNPPGAQGIYKYDGYPSQNLLAAPNTFAALNFGTPNLSLAIDRSTGNLFAAMAGGRAVHIFDEEGELLRSWTAINSVSSGGGIHVAIDNTQTYSAGRVYLSITAPENDVEVVDTNQRPVQFPATAPYIEGNRLTGTPSGNFGQVQYITVDEQGDIYVTDASKDEVDRFSSSGEFIRSYPAPHASPGNPDLGGVAVDPLNGTVLITEGSYSAETEEGGVVEFDPSGNRIGRVTADGVPGGFYPEGTPGVDSSGRLYQPSSNRVDIYDPAPPVPAVEYGEVTAPTATGGTVNATVDPNGSGAITACTVEYGISSSYGSSLPCDPDPASGPPGSNFTSPTAVSGDFPPLSTEQTYHYRVVATSGNGTRFGLDQAYTPHGVIGLRTDPPSGLTESSAQLNGSMVGDGTQTHYRFEWGPTSAYGNTSPGEPGSDVGAPTGPNRTSLPFTVSGLMPFTTYHYRVVAEGGSGTSYGEDVVFTTPPGVPTIGAQNVSGVHSDRAVMHADINPQGADTAYHFEFVDDASFQVSGFDDATKAPASADGIGMGKVPLAVSVSVDDITPGTLYHYRAVGVNAIGTGVPSVDRTFRTYPSGFDDKCPNAHVRQQTGAALLFDCRAYELASASNAGGYDVESDLVPGQTPFGGHPLALGPSQVLYGMHDGGIPGTGNPTNHGVDPYVATRGEDGWTTEYVGIPADNPFATAPFASSLEEADASLGTFAFGGPEICSPCFADGSSGQPIRLPDGSFVQGMTGSVDPGPGAEPAGFVGKPLSADGSHFVFGSTSQFETDGNSNGDVSIYDRDLQAGVTQVVSKTPGGTTLTGPGIGELDISSDGGRILIGQLVGTDSAGNRYWHMYMNVGAADQTIDLTPGTTSGALYDGMSADGTNVYLTTPDQLTGDDNDSSADIYRADVSSSSVTLSRVSAGEGGTGDTDACDPSANTIYPRWNSLGSSPNCDVLGVGGGGGVASGDGTIFFFSPESLDTSQPEQPVEDAPNLYVARPGAAPRYIRTLESSSNAPIPPLAHPLRRTFGSFGNGAGAAIDPSNHDIYVLDIGTAFGSGTVYKFDSEGHASLDFGINGKIDVTGMYGFYNVPTTLGIDSDPSSPNYRHIFVPELAESVVKVFDPSGGVAFDLPSFFPSAVAIDPSNGNIHVAELGGAVTVFDPSGTPITSFPTIAGPTAIAVDSSGRSYVANGGGPAGATGSVQVYGPTGTDLGELTGGPAYGVAVDPADDHVFVDRGNKATEFNAAHEPVGAPVGAGTISESLSLAAHEGVVVMSNHGKSNVAIFDPAVVPSDPNTDNPVLVNSLGDAGTRNTADFQVNSSGDNAVFASTLPLVDYENAGHREVYRYDEPSGAVDCASCNPTGEPATGEATLPTAGLALSDDGRVFFNSTQGLVDRDLNGRRDAYEWKAGEGIELISTGTGPLASSLLGISSDATDAYFFTRDTLVDSDHNGGRVKVYDARSFGGYPFVPAEVPCKASDECHGPGSQAAPEPNVGTIAGAPIGNAPKTRAKCKTKTKRKCRRGKGQRRARGRQAGKANGRSRRHG